jgi:23S rRNA (adenine2503-C2)-methyltransferase
MTGRAEHSLPNLLDFTQEELQDFISVLGKEKFRAQQIMKCLYQSGYTSFDEMTTLSRDFRTGLSQIARISRRTLSSSGIQRQNKKKALLRLEDGRFIESVLIPGKTTGRSGYPPRPDAPWTVNSV